MYFDFIANLESLVFPHKILKTFGQIDVVSNVFLQSGNAKTAQHKPLI